MVKKSTKRKRSKSSGGGMKRRKTGFQSMANNIGATTKQSATEWKNIDTGGTITVATGAPDWGALGAGVFLNGIPAGVSSQQRVGRKVSMKSMTFRWSRNSPGTLVVGANNFVSPVPFRILIIYDRSPNGAVPPITDVLTSNAFEAIQNLPNSDRFLVLADRIPSKDQGHVATYMGGKMHVKFGAGLICQWFDTIGGLITDISAGAIYVYFGCTGPTAAGNENFQFNCRIRYTDA